MCLKILAIAIVLMLVITPFGLASNINQLSTEQELDLHVEGALKWLIDKAIPAENGFKWPHLENDDHYYTSLYEGTPGICLLFLKAYEITGNETYLNYAEGGMRWLMSLAVEEKEGYKWPHVENSFLRWTYWTGLYEGTAGIGSIFLDFYKVLDNDTYLEYAEGAARWLINIGKIGHLSSFGTTCRWPHIQWFFPIPQIDVISGSAGIGLFLLKIYEVTENEIYLKYAKFAGNSLMKNAKHIDDCYTWDNYIGIFRSFISSGFSHGTSGVGYFFAELYKISKETKYLEYAEGAARWIIKDSVNDSQSGGVKWREVYRTDRPDDAKLFDTGWCYGPPGICDLFIDLYKITNNPEYLKYSELAAKWLMHIAIPEGEGYKWPRHLTENGDGQSADVTICHGAAGIGESFLDMYNLTKEPIYLEYANGAAEWLKQVAIKDNDGGYKWDTYGECHTGYSIGTSGIALFLIELGE